MSPQTIRSAWLEPATVNRKRQPYSRGLHRRVLGEKGIGRFAASRLANTLELITRETAAPTETRLWLDWRAFDNEALYLDQVPVDWEERAPQEIAPGGALDRLMALAGQPGNSPDQGTILRMAGYRTEWTEATFADLRRGLSRLVSPYARDWSPESFRIHLELPLGYLHLAGPVEPPELLKNPHYSVTALVAADGSYDLELKAHDERAVEVTGKFTLSSGRPPRCGAFDVEIRVWDRDSLRGLVGKSGQSISSIRRDLDETAGISVYRDGFRVLPYGEPKNDWLRLDLRRVQNPTLRLSNNQIVGYVQISSGSNPELRDQSNREGLIENSAFADFRELIVQVLAQLETFRYRFRRQPDAQVEIRPGHGVLSGFELTSLVDFVSQRHPSDHELIRAVSNEQASIARRVEHVRTVLARYTGLATLGTLIDTVLHDGRAPIANIRNEADLGRLEAAQINRSTNDLGPSVRNRFERIITFADLMGDVFRKIEPFSGRKRGRPTEVILEDALSGAVSILDTQIHELGVSITLPQTKTSTRVEVSEISQVIVNLLQNSLYWLRAVRKQDRRIVVEVGRAADGKVEIMFSDSGPGVPDSIRDHIFEPYFSTKPEGVGLGLSIAGQIVRDFYSGRLELLDGGPLKGATFLITLGRRV